MLFRSDRKSTRLNSSHLVISYAVFCLAFRDGMRTLREAALAKVMAGETSLAEVLEHTVAVEMPVSVPA